MSDRVANVITAIALVVFVAAMLFYGTGCGVQLPRQQPVGNSVRDGTFQEHEVARAAAEAFVSVRGPIGPCPGLDNIHVDIAAAWCNARRPYCADNASQSGCSEACMRFTRTNGFLIGIAPGGCTDLDGEEYWYCFVHEVAHGVRACWVHHRYDHGPYPADPYADLITQSGRNRVDAWHEEPDLWRRNVGFDSVETLMQISVGLEPK